MADTVKKEEFRNDKGLDQHDGACDYDGHETNNVHDANCVEDDIARASQRAIKERHRLLRLCKIVNGGRNRAFSKAVGTEDLLESE